MNSVKTSKDKPSEPDAQQFNDALRRVWSAPPMHKVKKKPADKPAQTKPPK
jgi:hypothetical protein